MSDDEKRGITEWRFKRLDWRFKKMTSDKLEIALVIRPMGKKDPKEVILRTVPFNIVSVQRKNISVTFEIFKILLF